MEGLLMSPLDLAIKANDIKSFHVILDCDIIDAGSKKTCLDGALKQIFQTCSNKDIIDFSENEIAMIKALLEHGADVNTSQHDETRVLDHSRMFGGVRGGSYRINRVYSRLLSTRRSLRWNKPLNPIQIAATSGCYQVLELLLLFKAGVNGYDFQNSPLHIALSHGHTECAKLLLQHGANMDFNRVLELAVIQQEPKYVRFLIDNLKKEIMKNLNRSSNNDDILIMSVGKGNLEIIGHILDLGANINDVESSHTCPLAESRNGEVAKFLIDRGASVKHVKCTRQTQCYSPLIQVLTKRNTKDNSVVEVIQVLLENGASGNDKCGDGKTPLMLAAENEGSMSVLQLLLDHGGELSEVDEQGNTALIHAVWKCCTQNVSFLLQFIKDRKELLNVQNGEGLTALMYATRLKNLTITKELMDQGADVNIKDKDENTALLHLLLQSYKNEDEIIKALIQAGCDVNWQNNDGLSPLMVAAQRYLKDTMCVLLDSGAQINAISKKDTKTALTHLFYQSLSNADYFRCLTCLLDRGAYSSYLEATALHKMILNDQLTVVAKLIRSGLGPANVVVNCELSSYRLNNNIIYAHRMLSSTHGTDKKEYYSPLSAAMCAGNSVVARFFVRNLFLTHSDISSLGHNKLLRQHLKRKNYTKCLDILNKISAQPVALFNLSFVAVSTAVGATPGREIRVNELPLPELIKEKLLFRV